MTAEPKAPSEDRVWRFEAPDEAATLAIARSQAAWLKPGDLVAL